MNLNICENLYADGTSAAPYWAYEHDIALTDADNCDANGNSISGDRVLSLDRRRPSRRPSGARCSSPTTRVSASGS